MKTTIALIALLAVCLAGTVYAFARERGEADACSERGGVAVQGDNTVVCLDPYVLLGGER